MLLGFSGSISVVGFGYGVESVAGFVGGSFWCLMDLFGDGFGCLLSLFGSGFR